MKFWAILIISILAVGYPIAAMADMITIVADEWAPYNNRPDATEPGYGIEIAKKVFEKDGHEIKYIVIPWNRAVKDTRRGIYNAIIGAYKEDAPDFIFPEEAFGISVMAFFTPKGSQWKYNGLESLLTVRIGLIKGYSYGDVLDTFFKNNRQLVQYMHGTDPLNKNIKKLIAGRFDVLVADSNVLSHKAKQMRVADQLVKAGESNNGNNVYIAFSPKIDKSRKYAEIFTRGIRKLRDSGELDNILAKYGLTDWK